MARNSWTTDAADEAAVAGSKYNQIKGTPGNDNLVGTAGRDRFHLADGGNDAATGLGGNDWFVLYQSYTKKDLIDGGDGNDTVWLGGHLIDPVLDSEHLKSVERFYLFDPQNDIVIADGFNDITITGRYNSVTIDASELTTGSVRFLGHHAGEHLIGGAGSDVFFSFS